jgi:hypothetical protein
MDVTLQQHNFFFTFFMLYKNTNDPMLQPPSGKFQQVTFAVIINHCCSVATVSSSGSSV